MYVWAATHGSIDFQTASAINNATKNQVLVTIMRRVKISRADEGFTRFVAKILHLALARGQNGFDLVKKDNFEIPINTFNGLVTGRFMMETGSKNMSSSMSIHIDERLNALKPSYKFKTVRVQLNMELHAKDSIEQDQFKIAKYVLLEDDIEEEILLSLGLKSAEDEPGSSGGGRSSGGSPKGSQPKLSKFFKRRS